MSFPIYFKTNAICRKVGQRAETGVFLSFVDSLVFFVAVFLFVLSGLGLLFSVCLCVKIRTKLNANELSCVFIRRIQHET